MKSLEDLLADQQMWTPKLRRAWREAHGLSLQQVADQIGVTRMTVWRWETGARVPRGGNRAAYSRLLRTLRDAIDHHG